MKKIIFSVLILSALLIFTSEAFCVKAEAKTALETRSEQMTNQIVNNANYYGWTVSGKKVTSRSASKIVTAMKIANSKKLFNQLKQVTTKNKTVFQYRGKNYTLEGMTIAFRQYAVGADIKKILRQKATAKLNEIIKYASKYRWRITKKMQVGTNSAIARAYVVNKRYSFWGGVTVARKNGKFVYTYQRYGASSTLGKIKDWLKRYAVS